MMKFEMRQDGTYELCAVDVNEIEINIPESYLGKPITSIKGSSIVRNKMIRKISMCDTITEMGNSAIFQCPNLEEVQLSKGLKTIGNNVFRDCPSLKHINLTESIEKIGNDCFEGSDAQTITVDRNNKKFDSRENCNAIIESATNALICGCTNTKIPNSIKCIGKSAFKGRLLIQIEIPDGVTSIEENAFSNCKDLSKVCLPSSIEYIGKNAFANCVSLQSILLPEKLVSIDEGAFKNCTSLREIILPKMLGSIGKEAFKLCSKLSQVVMYNSIRTIGNNAFKGCDLTRNIIFCGTREDWKRINLGNGGSNECLNKTVVWSPNGPNTILNDKNEAKEKATITTTVSLKKLNFSFEEKDDNDDLNF